MTELPNQISYQQFFKNPDFADIIVTVGRTTPKVEFLMHQIIVCTTSEYFKWSCDSAETNENGSKLLYFEISKEAFEVIAAWVYGYGENSFEQTDTQVIREILTHLTDYDMHECQEMETLRVALLKHLFQLGLSTIASGTNDPQAKFDVLERVCDFSSPQDLNMLMDLVRNKIPKVRVSAKYLGDLALGYRAGLAASVLLGAYQQTLDKLLCSSCDGFHTDGVFCGNHSRS
ncbi:uncharacterized protein DFL_000377 [Arthrobotrys flagrans]|uniref:BTB domain-containing protein n=1 Tax=Arthrobotrys flagrans TaxID=97331 RepID=A0A437ADJ4_ARTFL|nr:hypothetical protein DFL_000377 [Arthrobotrys flagrans]